MKELIQEIIKFRDERNWRQYHNPKDLAISLTLEAAELLENFQWSSTEEAEVANREAIAEELADVLMYAILLSDVMDFDLKTIIMKKLEKNRMKYPIEKAYGKKDKYTKL
jgi:NTP pyrophosphatase (non-canonical NTP hydrolase)